MAAYRTAISAAQILVNVAIASTTGYEKYGLISAAYVFSPSHIISRKLSTVESAEHYYLL